MFIGKPQHYSSKDVEIVLLRWCLEAAASTLEFSASTVQPTSSVVKLTNWGGWPLLEAIK